MITTPEIICDVFSFLHKDWIERIQLVSQFWNNVIIRHKNILPLRQFRNLSFSCYRICLYETNKDIANYSISVTKKNLRQTKGKYISSRYSQLTVDEVLNNLNDVVFDFIQIWLGPEKGDDYLLNLMKRVTKNGGRFRGRFGRYIDGRFDSKLAEIFDNYIIVDVLNVRYSQDSSIREVCANPEIVQLPLTPKEIRLTYLELKENDTVLNFTCNGKLNGANRLTISVINVERVTGYGTKEFHRNFIRPWFELYRTHQNPISLVGKFEIASYGAFDSAFDAVKKFLNSNQLRVKYSLETKEFHNSAYGPTKQYLNRRCVLHETDSYVLVIEMAYGEVTDMSSINASDLDQPPCKKMETISFCVKSL